MIIAICGIDGSGKTTLGKMLSESIATWYRAQGEARQVAFTKLLSNESEMVRYYKLLVEIDPDFDERSQNYVFAFERVRTANEVLRPMLQHFDVVVLDRYIHCDIAFSRARGRDESMFHRALQHVPVPDIGFITDSPVDVALPRIEGRRFAPWKFQENERLLRAARSAYLDIAHEFDFTVIDTTGPLERSLEHMLAVVKSAGVPEPAAAERWTDGVNEDP